MKVCEQKNPYAGAPARPWIQLRLHSATGETVTVKLLADTGSPCAIVIGRRVMEKVRLVEAPNLQTNFGLFEGGWVRVVIPGVAFEEMIVGFASDEAADATRRSHTGFDGLVGLPLLRRMEYGGNNEWFWVRKSD